LTAVVVVPLVLLLLLLSLLSMKRWMRTAKMERRFLRQRQKMKE
jgi:uncharacterized membrane protein YqiK